MNKEEAIERFNGIINAMSISIAQSKFYPSKAELNELCGMAIEALSERNIARDIATILENEQDMRVMLQNADRPTLDEVVRCKDCKWRQEDNICDLNCRIEYLGGTESDLWFYVKDEDYCSYGERREG